MKAEDYRKKKSKTFEVQTSAGPFKVRRPSLTELLRRGKIPTTMYNLAARICGLDGSPDLDPKDPEQVKGMLEFMGVYVSAACIEPKVVVEPQVDKDPGVRDLCVDDLDEQDLFILFHATFNRREETGLNSGTFSEKSGSGAPGRSGAKV